MKTKQIPVPITLTMMGKAKAMYPAAGIEIDWRLRGVIHTTALLGHSNDNHPSGEFVR
jgi:hypothetical protein